MAAIRVAQLARLILVFSKEERCVVALGAILVKQLIHRLQESPRLFPGRRALAAHTRLKICHQKGSRHALTRDIANHQTEPSIPEMKKVVIVAADGASRRAKTYTGERLKRRIPLWQEARLYLLR